MPWSSGGSLPSNVQKLKGARKRQWIHVANSALGRGLSDGQAIRMANGVVKKQRASAGRKEMADDYRQKYLDLLEQHQDLRTYVDAIEKPILDDDSNDDLDLDVGVAEREVHGSFMDRLKGLIGLGSQKEPEEVVVPAFSLKELPDGRLRYMAFATNNYEDRSGQYFPAEAHREYIDWAEKEGGYPELWPFHCYGQRLGVADWMDFDGNLLISSGLIDAGMEAKAKAWAGDPDTAMSHGFFKNQVGNDIVQYRSFEQSVLPKWAAANPFTDFSLGVKEMALTPAKKAALAEKGYSPDEIAGLETYTDQFRQKLAAAGVSFKDIEEPAVETPPGAVTVPPAPPTDAAVGGTPSFTLDELRAVVREEVAAATKEYREAATKEIGEVKDAVAGFKAGSDEVFANLWAKRAAATGVPASRSGDTVVAGTRESEKPNAHEWLGKTALFDNPLFGGGGNRGGN